ncbi:MAG TPA: hypothetical protein VLF15_02890, partial [Pseudoxanthomonas sp.]|nr:hypothetical protein [Pseudoxanthomonas sp.]
AFQHSFSDRHHRGLLSRASGEEQSADPDALHGRTETNIRWRVVLIDKPELKFNTPACRVPNVRILC